MNWVTLHTMNIMIIVITMQLTVCLAMTKKWKQYCSSGKLLEDMKHRLLTANDGAYFRIQVHNIDAIAPRSYKFYAERGCTQRTYHYILPLRLLFGGGNDKLQYTNLSPEISEALSQWWRNTAVVPNSVTNKRKHQPRGGRQQGNPSTFYQVGVILYWNIG